jgi:uncharacterized protein YndB with AHSA1/START domain
MVVRERGMSAPPEVVFNTATDPARFATWLPPSLREDGRRPVMTTDDLLARWTPEANQWSAELRVGQLDSGGAVARLTLTADLPDERLTEIADESLARLARHVADNLTAG